MVVPDIDRALALVSAVAAARGLVDQELLDSAEGAEEAGRHKKRLVSERDRQPNHVKQVVLHNAEGLQVVDSPASSHIRLAP